MFKFTDLVILDLTEGCNINCKYCLMLNKDRHRGEVISFDLFRQIINKIIWQWILQGKQHSTTLSLVFHGGEPFSVGKENFYKFAEYAHTAFANAGIEVHFGTQTNGTYIDDEYMKILNKFGFSLGLSLDDLGPGNDLRIPNSKAFFEDKLRIIQKNNIDVGVISVVTTQNVPTLPNFMEEISKTWNGKYTLLQFENPDPETLVDVEARPEDYFSLYEKVAYDFVRGDPSDYKLSLNTKMTLVDLLTDHNSVFRSGCGGKICGTAIGMISVRPDGWFGNCDRFPDETEFNNLLRVETFDFLSNVQLRRAIDLALIKDKILRDKECDTCRADYMCHHGCITFDFPRTGEFRISDFTCDLYLHIFDFVESNLIDMCTILASRNAILQSSEEIYNIKPEAKSLLAKHNIRLQLSDDSYRLGFSLLTNKELS